MYVTDVGAPLQDLMMADPAPGSRFATFMNTPVEAHSLGESPVGNAIDSVVSATIAGLDHTRLLATALADSDVAFATATVTRGAVEAFARAWWLLSSEDSSQLVVRWLSGMAKELSVATHIDPNVPLFDLAGEETPGSRQHEAVLDDIERLTGSRKPTRVSYTELAVALQDELKNTNGRAYYSHLSAVAHAELLGLHGFISPTSQEVTFVTPEIWGVNYALQAFGAGSLVVRHLITSCGPNLPPTDPIAVAHDWVAGELTEAHRLAFTRT
ncbi:hypothetical protein [Pseudoclavibacter terrae]|uniref:Uncharacterized protein n=1 Tax=Pseudoclavibacter terrae TaxID=1530195 RepID=A0A7J5AXF3_9MICO|nr:hypothetical protein [Pseudoclavibacter terrae]KAB1636122.1 hypothetical protein F8O03_17885 [Pseudoclavibacter terrae]